MIILIFGGLFVFNAYSVALYLLVSSKGGEGDKRANMSREGIGFWIV